MKKQAGLAAWNAGFMDGDGCISQAIMEKESGDCDYTTTPAVHITNNYHSGLFDAEGNIEMRVMNQDGDFGVSPRCQIRQRITECPIVSKLTKFAESIGVDYSVNNRSYGDGESQDQFAFAINGVNDVDCYLRELEPYLVVKKEQAQIMIEDIIPRLKRKDHHNRRGFLRLMRDVDRMNSMKGGNRGKYDLEYFEDLWEMSLD